MGSKGRETDFYGMFEAAMDNKTGRFIVPMIVFKYLHNMVRFTVDPLGRFLEVRSEDDFQALVERINAAEATLPVDVISALRMDYLGFSSEGQIDGSLRLVVPKRMRDVLNEEDDLVLVLVKDCLQVWGASRYREERRASMARMAGVFPAVQHLIMGIARPEPVPVSAVTQVENQASDGDNV